MDGAVAASAPILAFDGQSFDTNAFWRVVTRDATPAAGSEAGCDVIVRNAFAALFQQAATLTGRSVLTSTLQLCQPLSETDAVDLARFLQVAWDNMAMVSSD